MNAQSVFDDPTGLALLGAFIAGLAAVLWGLGRVCVAYPRARVPLLLAALGAGGFLGYQVLGLTSSYVAALVWGEDLFLMAAAGFVSAILSAVPRTRRSGIAGLVGTLVMFVGFFAVYLGGYYLNLHAWRNDAPIPIG
jgi:hypothetical protein